MLRNREFGVVATILSFALAGCGGGPSDLGRLIEREPTRTPLYVQFLMDATESYAPMRPRAMREARHACRALLPGDRLVLRLINQRAFASEAMLSDVSRPRVETSRLDNPRLREEKAARIAVGDSSWRAGCDLLDSLTLPKRRSRLDLLGAITAASLSGSAVDTSVRRVVVIATDLEEPVEGNRLIAGLHGIRVVMLGVESAVDRLAELGRRRREFERLLQAAGARDVRMIAPGEGIDLDDLRTPYDEAARSTTGSP